MALRRLMLCACALALALHAVHDVAGFGDGRAAELFEQWFQPIAFLACGLATVLRARRAPQRGAWALLGTGLMLYAAGSVYYNLTPDDPGFPSLADALWLSLYPLAFLAMAAHLRTRFANVSAAVWLDGLIGGSVVAALVAALMFDPVFGVTVAGGAASVARLGYPVGDLIAVGVVIAVWSVAGRRLDRMWALIGIGFSLLAIGDGFYVVQAARGEWAPGNVLDYPYALATMALATAAFAARPDLRPIGASDSMRPGLPVASAVTALGLVTVSLTDGLNPLATALAVLALVAVVMRLGATLARLNRQSLDLAARAATDPLTGLPNHRTLHDRLTEETHRARVLARPLSVVTLDIDHFKVINDTWGHTEGDLVLQAVARVLSEQVSGEQMVGRVGGEEFALVLPDLSSAEAVAAAERCRAAIAELRVHGQPVFSSAGVASYPDDDGSGSRLLEYADGALYWAKRSGRKQTKRYDPREVVLLSSAEQRAQVQEVLESDGVLVPVFQPIVELATGRVAGYEALTRFTGTQPVRPPDLWFAQARRCGLGPALEARAIELSLAAPDRPAGTFLSLNVSPGALVSEEVAAVLPLDLDEIVIELTEDEVFSSDQALDERLAGLRARGARIAIDDAGAGYAGLQQLIRVKPEIMKLDRSLISGVDGDASKIALLDALTRFASSTGAAVCGEGIETVEELRALARADATYAQGYALARPAPAWAGVAEDVAAHTSSEVRLGMRLSRTVADAPLSLGEVAERVAQARSHADLDAVLTLIKRLLHADEVAISKVLAEERCVVTLSDWLQTNDRFSFDDYPTTEHVVSAQVLGQVIEGDPASDPAELGQLAELGFGAVLMAPVVFRGETVGLLELYRRAARPWTGAEIDQARLIANSLGPAVQVERGAELPWTPEAFGDGARSSSI